MVTFFDKNNKFDIWQFLQIQKIIMLQWEDREEIKNMDEESLINRFSLYICHILDEIKEVNDAKKYEDIIEEMIDVFMYLGTSLSLFIVKYNMMNNNRPLEGLLLTDEQPFNKYKFILDKDFLFSDFSDFSSDIIYYLSGVREYFPQRKWHKKKEKFSKEKFNEILEKSFMDIVTLMYMGLFFILNKTKMDYKLVNDLIIKKQKRIVKIAMKNGSNQNETERDFLYKLDYMLNSEEIEKDLSIETVYNDLEESLNKGFIIIIDQFKKFLEDDFKDEE